MICIFRGNHREYRHLIGHKKAISMHEKVVFHFLVFTVYNFALLGWVLEMPKSVRCRRRVWPDWFSNFPQFRRNSFWKLYIIISHTYLWKYTHFRRIHFYMNHTVTIPLCSCIFQNCFHEMSCSFGQTYHLQRVFAVPARCLPTQSLHPNGLRRVFLSIIMSEHWVLRNGVRYTPSHRTTFPYRDVSRLR